MAFDPKSLDELARKLADAVPPGLTALRDDLERNFKAVLRRSRERLEELEQRIAALEKGQPK